MMKGEGRGGFGWGRDVASPLERACRDRGWVGWGLGWGFLWGFLWGGVRWLWGGRFFGVLVGVGLELGLGVGWGLGG